MYGKISSQGVLLFVFIPLVLFLFLYHPFSVPVSFGAAILIMGVHRFIAKPYFLRNSSRRCFWCARVSKARVPVEVNAGTPVNVDLCNPYCKESARKFFDFCNRYQVPLKVGIFVPLVWYVVTMLLNHYGLIRFPEDWNRFIFRFFIALSVVTVSFAYQTGRPSQKPSFPFPIHNLFLIGAKNTLLVFRYVGIWWLLASILFLYRSLS